MFTLKKSLHKIKKIKMEKKWEEKENGRIKKKKFLFEKFHQVLLTYYCCIIYWVVSKWVAGGMASEIGHGESGSGWVGWVAERIRWKFFIQYLPASFDIGANWILLPNDGAGAGAAEKQFFLLFHNSQVMYPSAAAVAAAFLLMA